MKEITSLKRTFSGSNTKPRPPAVNKIPIFTEITCATILISIGQLLSDNYLWYFITFVVLFIAATEMTVRIAAIDKLQKQRRIVNPLLRTSTQRKRIINFDVNQNFLSVFGKKGKSKVERLRRRNNISSRNRYMVETHV